MATLVFFHGLNTYDDGLVHIGPLTFGKMSASWKRELTARGLNFIDISGMGFGPVDEQADRALAFLEKEGVLNSNEPLHFLGHSMGGLVARAASHRAPLRGRVKTVMTIGTPHQGADITESTLSLENSSPRLYKFMKFFGYDVYRKRETFAHFTTDRLREVSSRYAPYEGVRCLSFIGAAKYEELSLPLKLLYTTIHPKDHVVASDGFISAASQTWCEVGGVFALDHLGEMGVFLHTRLKRRRTARQEFLRLVQRVVELVEGKA